MVVSKPMKPKTKSSARNHGKNRPATKRDIEALAMGMAGNIDNLVIGLNAAVRFMQRQHDALIREMASQRRRRVVR